MKKQIFALSVIASLLLPTTVLSPTALAASGDISITSQDIRFAFENPLEGQVNTIYATVSNSSPNDLLGTVKFFVDGKQIQGDQPISIFAKSSDGVFVNWAGAPGNHKIEVVVIPWDGGKDDPSNNRISTEQYVIPDLDRDGIPDAKDEDMDGDGVKNAEDHFPRNPNEQVDTDGDGAGDKADNDDDNDGVPDEFDDLPLDPNESLDTDHDGIGNITDQDDDNDGISDNEEEKIKLDPLKSDTDGDGVNDGDDAFPSDPEEQFDTDKDKIGNKTDLDDDNDGIHDEEDKFPLNKPAIIEIDNEEDLVGLREKQTFDATPSYDDDGKIVSYIWNIDGTMEKEGNAISHSFQEPGEHMVKLTIIDDQGQSVSKEFQVNVVNLGLYRQIIATLIVISLASLIYFKYISGHRQEKKPGNN